MHPCIHPSIHLCEECRERGRGEREGGRVGGMKGEREGGREGLWERKREKKEKEKREGARESSWAARARGSQHEIGWMTPGPPSGSHGTQAAQSRTAAWRLRHRNGGPGRRGGCRNLPSESSGPDGPDGGSTHDDGASGGSGPGPRRWQLGSWTSGGRDGPATGRLPPPGDLLP